jgi:hypothetical protein
MTMTMMRVKKRKILKTEQTLKNILFALCSNKVIIRINKKLKTIGKYYYLLMRISSNNANSTEIQELILINKCNFRILKLSRINFNKM